MIQGLHHNAYRCRDAEETRKFYEGFLGLPLAHAFEIRETKTGRETRVLHLFFEMQDGSFLAFFEVPDNPFDFKDQHDYDLHIALQVAPETLVTMKQKAQQQDQSVRGIAHHGFIDSIYFRDPNGYVIELTAPTLDAPEILRKGRHEAHAVVENWQETKPQAGTLTDPPTDPLTNA